MPKVRINYDGWLALPAFARRRFALGTGDELEIEITDEVIVLRPARQAGAVATSPTEEPLPAAPHTMMAPEPALAAPTPIAKRGPGRPRKTPSAAAALPASLKTRGRRAAAPAE